MNKVILSLLVLCQVLGDVWLSHGMRQVGAVNTTDPAALLTVGWHVLLNPWIMLGALFLTSAVLLYLTAVSRFDLSYVLPMTASKYVLSALFAWLILQEHISATRWFGPLIVAFGVLLVGVSERNGNGVPKENPPKKHFSSVVLLAPTSLSVLLSKTSVAIVGLALIESIGDMLFAAGMKQVGEVATFQLNTLLRLARRAVVNPLLGLGVLSMAATFLLTLALLSWADLSLVMPMTALSYPFSVLGARWFLSETVNTARLVGTGFICLGVALISLNATGL